VRSWGATNDKEAHHTVDSYDFAEKNARKEKKSDNNIHASMHTYFGYIVMYLMRFLVAIRGARTPPPRIEEPVTKMPLDTQVPY